MVPMNMPLTSMIPMLLRAPAPGPRAKMSGELHDKDAVFRNQPNERDQPNLAINVERRGPQEREHERARKRQRHRSSQNDERIAEALELRGQDQIDENARER